MRRWLERLQKAKGVRAYAFEVSIVVVGVLIALGAQELVDDWNWSRKVEEAEQQLAAEGSRNALVYAEHLVTAPCVVAQIDALDSRLREPGAWPGVPTIDSGHGLVVIRAPSRLLSGNVWQSLMADGTASHFSGDRQIITSEHYAAIAWVNNLLNDIDTGRARLDYLADPGPLDLATRLRAREELSLLRQREVLAQASAQWLLYSLVQLDRLPPERQADLDSIVDAAQPNSTADFCRRTGLPLGDWRTALKSPS
jgi:hypothetical protein